MTIIEAKEKAAFEANSTLSFIRDVLENGQKFGYRTAEDKIKGSLEKIYSYNKMVDKLFDSILD